MSKAAVDDLEIAQGEDFSEEYEFQDNNGDAVDLTGSTIRGKIRQYPESSTVIASFVCTLLSTLGHFKIALSSTTTAAIVCDNSNSQSRVKTAFSYDVEWVNTSGEVQRILEGIAYVSPEDTR